jgi:hypothetical protein
MENGKDRLSKATDRLTRAIVALYTCDLVTREILLGIRDTTNKNRALFELKTDQWEKVKVHSPQLTDSVLGRI